MNGTTQKSILVAIGAVVMTGVFGSALSSEHTAQILGFCAMICVSLLGLLQQIRTAAAQAAEAERIAKGLEVAAKKVAEVAVKQDKAVKEVQEVKKTLEAVTEAHQEQAKVHTEMLTSVAEEVHKVEKATNSLTDRLVETTRLESHAAGAKEERDRAAEEKEKDK